MYSTQDKVVIFSINEAGEISENGTLADMAMAANFPSRHSYYDHTYQSFWSADREGVIRTEIQPRKFKDALANNASDMLWEVSPTQPDKFLLVRMANGSQIYILDKNQEDNLSYIGSIKDADIIEGDIQFADENDLLNIASIHTIFQEDLFVITKDQSYKYLNFSKILDSISIGKIQCVKLLGKKLLIGTLKGFLVFDLEQKVFISFPEAIGFKDFAESSIHVIEPVNQDSVWLGTNHGVFLFSMTRGVLSQFSPDQTGDNFLPTSTIYHLSILEDSTFWLATRDGLVHWAGIRSQPLNEGERVELYSTKEGLPDKHCVSVFEDENQFIWVATIKGLVQLEPITGDMWVYNHKDGLKQEYFLEYSHHQDDEGDLYFGGLNGLTYFSPNDFKDVDFSDPYVPLTIVDFEQYNQETEKFESRTSELLANNSIVLRPNARIFSLRLALADYRSAEKHQFSYRIPGYQEEWQTDASHLIRISGIPYGKYNLQIRGRLADGRYSSHQLEIPIIALRPFYLNVWFYIVLFIVLIFLIFSWYIARIRLLQKRQKELEEAVHDRTAQIESDKQIIEHQAEELRKMDELKSRFFANVSHELRTPLTLILSPLQVMIKRQRLQREDEEYIKMAHKNGQRLLKLVNELLDLSKLEAGKMMVKYTNIKLHPFISRIVASFESYAKEADINLVFSYQLEKDLGVKIDMQKTEIILINLLSNALKFTEAGGSIEVNVFSFASPEAQNPKPGTRNLLLSVSDSGRGIHPKDLSQIFDRFYQSEQTEVAEGGTGIGLALSYEFAKVMDGELSVESEWGKGSIFSLSLPFEEVTEVIELVKVENIDSAISPLLPSSLTNENDRKTLLLVEDNPDLRRFIKSLLDPTYHVITAQHGKEALELLPKIENCDLIISDIMMPVMDGYQILQMVKSNVAYNKIPMIMLTARAALDDKLRALRIGVDDYMLKPFDEDELLARVSNLIKNREARKEEAKHAIEINGITAAVPSELETTNWLVQVEKTVTEKLNLHEFNIETLAYDMSMSRQNLNAKIKKMTGLTASQYLQEARLIEARKILETRSVNSVKAAVLEVGIKDVKYFSKKIKERFGKSPSAYL